jgi:hypothetical protein
LGGRLAAPPEAGDVAEDGLLLAVGVIAADEESLEHGLVHESPQHRAGVQVGFVAASDDGQGIVERLHDVCGFVGGSLDPVVSLVRSASMRCCSAVSTSSETPPL